MSLPALSIRSLWRVLAAWLVLAVGGCAPPAPIRVGLLIDLTGRTSRVMEDGRNGVLLAVDQLNQAGGIQGRRIELVIQDLGSGQGTDVEAAQALLRAGVALVIGPFASSVAARVVPVFDEARVLLLCPSSTAVSLAGRDDYLVRLYRTTQDSARDYAQALHARGQRRIGMATFMRDAINNGAWRAEFGRAFTALGGTLVADVGFGVDARPTVYEVVRSLLAADPDGLVFVATGVDAARLAQQVAKQGATLPLAAPDWADSAALFDLGGQTVEGMLVGGSFRMDDRSARYRDFRRVFVERFGSEPNFRSAAAYDALVIGAQALQRMRPGETARDAVLRHGPFQGLQQPIAFDRFGDAVRSGSFMVVRDGRFEPVP